MTTLYLFSILLVVAQYPMYQYADGSGNIWVIQKNELEYRPVTPDQSSSGTYSGGTPFKKEISQEQYREARILCVKALRAKGSHQEDRTMGSGVVTEFHKDGTEGKSCILKMGSAEQKALEDWLRSFNH